jgi:cystathionine beta-lyase/cystathionine gamma-synthase
MPVRAGYHRRVGAPLDRSATWPYEDGEPGRFSYVRADHPTGAACEEALGALDGGHALLYPSGMGAVTTVVLTGTVFCSTTSPRGARMSSSSTRPAHRRRTRT